MSERLSDADSTLKRLDNADSWENDSRVKRLNNDFYLNIESDPDVRISVQDASSPDVVISNNTAQIEAAQVEVAVEEDEDEPHRSSLTDLLPFFSTSSSPIVSSPPSEPAITPSFVTTSQSTEAAAPVKSTRTTSPVPHKVLPEKPTLSVRFKPTREDSTPTVNFY